MAAGGGPPTVGEATAEPNSQPCPNNPLGFSMPATDRSSLP